MSDEVVYAVFEPSEAKLLTTTSQTQLLVENPILASALSNIFPYLLLMDNLLEIFTWTNGDPYQNFLFITGYSVLVLYWHTLRFVALPLLIAASFSSIVWRTSTIMRDSKYGEKPTIDEVLQTLHNITVRFDLFFRPARHVRFTRKNYLKFVISAILVTPAHAAVARTFLSPTVLTWLIGVFFLTYHSPWAYTIRHLLWRSLYIRLLAYYMTGLDIKISTDEGKEKVHGGISRVHSPSATDVEDEDSSAPIITDNDFTIVKKVIASPKQLRQTVRFDILENERRWFGFGWSKLLLPNERASYCYEQSMRPSPDPQDDDFEFPVCEHDLYKYTWQWMDERWELDLEFNKSRYKTGWVYYDSNWGNPGYRDQSSKYTRTRNATADKEFKDIPKKYINPLAEKEITEGPRVNGKNFKIKKDAFRVRSLGVKKLNTWQLREKKKLEEEQYKARIKDLKQEKEDEKNSRVAEIKRRREIKEEKERYERMAEKMHAKKVERMRKKEKRNKALRER
ncbi:hypothetical protein CA3LBN_003099 [Candidozyma haemuli]|uniref:rRNA-processing protein CGR1 n=1 Tax=Candidozyma haemuli TaxID=45357 RepID=A0ABX8I699_9ASCO|nr:hypothetical protein CA3LBN_003099 [[Candida] haemuloni]